jgi:hypothetical protein
MKIEIIDGIKYERLSKRAYIELCARKAYIEQVDSNEFEVRVPSEFRSLTKGTKARQIRYGSYPTKDEANSTLLAIQSKQAAYL